MQKIKITIIDYFFMLLILLKITGLKVAYSYQNIIFFYLVLSFLVLIFRWLLNPQTAQQIATKIYINKNKKALKEAEKEAKKIIKNASQTK